jgi:hypothetical protein
MLVGRLCIHVLDADFNSHLTGILPGSGCYNRYASLSHLLQLQLPNNRP